MVAFHPFAVMLSSCGPPSRLAPAAYPLFLRRRGAVRMRSASEGFCHRPSLVNSITNFPAWQEGSGRCSEIFYLFAAGNLGKSPEAPRSRSGLSTNRLFPAQDGGIRQKGAAGGRQTYFCARLRRNNFPHNNTRVLLEQWDSGSAVTGGDVLRIAQNSRRKHKVLSRLSKKSFRKK